MGMALAAGSDVMKMRGAQEEAVQQAAYQRYNAKVMRVNAASAMAIAEYNAKLAEKESRHAQFLEQRKFNQDQGRRRLLFGSSGTDMGSGSSLEVLAGAAADHEMNLRAIDYTGRVKAGQARYAGRAQAAQFGYQASLSRSNANMIMKGLSWKLLGIHLADGAAAFGMGNGSSGAGTSTGTLSDGGLIRSKGGSYNGFGR